MKGPTLRVGRRVKYGILMTFLNSTLIANYVSHKVVEAGHSLSVLKLQKLLYYVEAWHLAFFNIPVFEEDFQAWVHGPVNSSVFAHFKYAKNKFMYSDINMGDVEITNFETIPAALNSHIENVLETYAKYSGAQLEELTHNERPWVEARIGLKPYEASKNPISKDLMRDYYRSLMSA